MGSAIFDELLREKGVRQLGFEPRLHVPHMLLSGLSLCTRVTQ